jgi:Protein of unknown function DUF262
MGTDNVLNIATPSIEEIEGLDEADGGWGEYSIDSVFVRNATRSVSDMIRRIDNGRCVLDPEFQREFVWPEDKQSKLIQHCIMRIPLPVFYLAAASDGKIIIVDGLQRLTTFHRYIKGEFKLKGLSDNGSDADQLEGKTFSQLDIHLQERILDTQLITYILDANAPERARLDIFERVNSGVPLTRQQMRNALYNGPATIWLREAATGFPFRSASGGGLDAKAMRDREAINRFCAFFLLGWKNYKSGEMDSFLASALTYMNKQLSDKQLLALRHLFDTSMRLNREAFKEHAFRKSLASGGSRRQVLNIALFDVCSVNFAKRFREITSNSDGIEKARRAMASLLADPQFVKSITYSTNSTQAVTTRFELAGTALDRALK